MRQYSWARSSCSTIVRSSSSVTRSNTMGRSPDMPYRHNPVTFNAFICINLAEGRSEESA